MWEEFQWNKLEWANDKDENTSSYFVNKEERSNEEPTQTNTHRIFIQFNGNY